MAAQSIVALGPVCTIDRRPWSRVTSCLLFLSRPLEVGVFEGLVPHSRQPGELSFTVLPGFRLCAALLLLFDLWVAHFACTDLFVFLSPLDICCPIVLIAQSTWKLITLVFIVYYFLFTFFALVIAPIETACLSWPSASLQKQTLV